MTEWQDIYDASGGGRLIMVANKDSIRIAFWQDGEKHENFGTKGGGWIDWSAAENNQPVRGLRFKPTHWQPLPDPPQ